MFGDNVHIYIGADTALGADAYYTAIQYDEADVGYTGMLNIITAIDSTTKTVTLQNPLLYKTSTKGYLQQIYKDQFHFKDLTLEHDGLTNPGLSYNYICNLFTTNMRYINPNGGLKGISPNQTFNLVKVIHQSSFNCHHVKAYIGKAVCMHFNHGTVNGSITQSDIDAQFTSDGAIVMYAGPVNILSYKNNLKWHSFSMNGSIVTDASAVYFGAKCRDCVSDGDTLNGFYAGFRGYFGSYNATIKNAITKNSKGSTLQIVGGCDLKLLNNIFDYPGFIRYCPRAVIEHNIFKSTFVSGVSTAIVHAFQVLPRMDDSTVPQGSIYVRKNKIQGGFYITVGLENFEIEANEADMINLYMSTSYCKNGMIYNNNVGGITVRSPNGVSIFNNKIKDTALRAFTVKRLGGIQTSGTAILNIYDNEIVSEADGIHNETTNRSFDVAITTRNNNIICGASKLKTRITTITPPLILDANKDLVAVGQRFQTDNGIGYWELKGWSGSTANFEYAISTEVSKISINLGSFLPVANGLFTMNPRTITGLNIGDKIDITCSSTAYARGEFIGVVTEVDTLQIYFKERANDATLIAAQSLYIYIHKAI